MGEKIGFIDGKLIVPDNPVIPYIRGDGVGVDVTPVMQKVIDTAVEKGAKVPTDDRDPLISAARDCITEVASIIEAPFDGPVREVFTPSRHEREPFDFAL